MKKYDRDIEKRKKELLRLSAGIENAPYLIDGETRLDIVYTRSGNSSHSNCGGGGQCRGISKTNGSYYQKHEN